MLDGARWAHEQVDVSACARRSRGARPHRAALARLQPEADGRPLAVRLTLRGTTAAHARLVARRDEIEAQARSLAFRFADDCWIERLAARHLRAAAARRQRPNRTLLDVEALIAAAADEPHSKPSSPPRSRRSPTSCRAICAPSSRSDAPALARLRALARDHLAGALALDAGP